MQVMFRVSVLTLAILVVFAGIVNVFPLLESEVDSGVSSVATALVPLPALSGSEEPLREGIAESADESRPSCIISGEPANIVRGGRASIAWGSKNADTAWLSHVGSVLPRGGVYVSPDRSTSYTLTVRSPDGRFGYCGTWVTVN